jgi:hypothetical protein
MADAMDSPQTLVAAIVTQGDRLALIAAGRARWQATSGYTFVPIELPSAALDPHASLADAISRITEGLLGQLGRPLASAQLYGPSQRHAIDRLDAALEEPPLPVLRLERATALDSGADASPGTGLAFRRVLVRAYRVVLAGDARPGAGIAGILWGTPQVLRLAMRGLPMSELLARTDIRWQAGEDSPLPEDALAYVPSDYGERHLLRVVAKYGAQAVFQADGGSGRSDGSAISRRATP